MWNDFRKIVTIGFKVLGWLLVAPWIVLELVLRAVGAVRGVARGMVRLPLARATHARCPRGHASNLQGVFECRGCGALYAGYAFGPCPVCSSSAGYVNCEHCGFPIRNPFL
jgi:hypothetical protein